MKRSKANKVNETTKKLSETINNYEQLQSVGEILPETLHRITSNASYKVNDILLVGNCLLKKYGFNFRQKFKVVAEVSQLNKLNLSTIIEQEPIFIIYQANNWVTCCITKLDSRIFVLHVGETIAPELARNFNGTAAEFKNHHTAEQNGVMALQNMLIILNGLRKDKKAFVDKFTEIKFCSQSELEDIKNYFADVLRSELLKILVCDLINDKDYGKFKENLNQLLETYLKYASSYIPLKRYVDLVMEEATKFEKDANYVTDRKREEEIATAKEEFLGGSNMEEQQEELTETCPLQKKKFIEILTYLKISLNFEEDLKEVSERLQINSNKLKELLEILKEETEGKKKTRNNELVMPKQIKVSEKRVIPSTEGVKSLEQLLSEIQLGADREEKEEYRNNKTILQLEADYYKVQQFSQQWNDKGPTDIYTWAKLKKNSLFPEDLHKTLGIMNRANQLVTGYELRDPQILAVLLFASKGGGTLFQIPTGEGKTTITSLIATYQALRGLQVDVITSNEVLAREGAQNRANFYEMFGLTVSDNNPEEEIQRAAPRGCYSANIVYGTIGHFQFDYLRDQFENFGIRAGRGFNFVILDEVDSMTIDQGSYIAKLAAPFPGMDSLKYVYLKIWQELLKAEEEIFSEVKGNLEKMGEVLGELEYANYEDDFLHKITEGVKRKIQDANPMGLEFIPVHLKDFGAQMLETWIDNALYARYGCQENRDYVVKVKNREAIIIPVDYQSTGVTLKNTIWSHALHQFVQLKHNVNVTAESLTSSSISNIGYIKLFKNQLCGLTGTLGSVAEQKLLSKIYEIDYAKIPTYKEKRFKELEGVVVTDQQWGNAIALLSILKARKGGSTLIICRTISDLMEISENIHALKKLEGFNLKIKTYPDEDASEIVNQEVGTSEIIVATNIAGRGSDFRTSPELEKKGGLHVCLTFLPVNQRVQDQAFGRTSRQGNRGTAQLIIRSSDVINLGVKIVPAINFGTIIPKRDEIEKLRLEHIKAEKLNEIDFYDGIMNEFAQLYRTFKNSDNKFVADDLKEFWAFWLQKQNFVGTENAAGEISNFERAAKSILEGKITHNPYYSIRQAELFLSNNQVEEAGEALTHALGKGGSEFFYSAHLKFFEVAMEKGGQIRERLNKALKRILLVDVFTDIEKDEGYKKNAEGALEKCIKGLEVEINYIKKNLIGEASTSSSITPFFGDASTPPKIKSPPNADFLAILNGNQNNVLVNHIVSRYVALITFRDHAESLLQQLQKSKNDKTKGLAIGGRIPNYLQDLITKNDCEPNLKQSLHEAELSELGLIGLETIYALRDVHDVSDYVICASRKQIVGGFAALGLGIAFPISLPIMGPIAGTMVAEGLLDIVIELLSRGDSTFNKAAYIKGKCISYGITVATMGLNAILMSKKILSEAIKACRGLSAMLRKCPYLKSVCVKLANQIDRLGKYLSKLKNAAECINLAEKSCSRASLLRSGLKSIAKVSIETVALSLLTDRLINKNLQKLLEEIKLYIRNKVSEIVNATLEEELKFIEQDSLRNLICEITTGSYGEIGMEVLKEISVNLLNHCKSWKIKLASFTIDSLATLPKICTCAQKFCNVLKSRLTKQKHENTPAQTITNKELTIALITQHIFGLISHLTLKYAHSFILNPIAGKLNKLLPKHETAAQRDTSTNENFSEILTAYETLGLKPNASLEEIKKARTKLVRKYHPDMHGPEASSQKFQAVKEAADLLLGHGVTKPNVQNFAPAHRGNIETLSRKDQQHIIIKDKNGKILEEFGTNFREKPPLLMIYIPPLQDNPGHYIVPQIVIQSSGINNCFYDAYVAIQKNRGIIITASEARAKAETPNLTNFITIIITQTSVIFNNLTTRNIYLNLQAHFLVGGFKNYLGDILPFSSTFEETCVTIYCDDTLPNSFGGSYSELKPQFPNRSGIIEIHHIVAVDSYAGTIYEKIDRNDMPAIAMEFVHHRYGVSSSGNSRRAIQWRTQMRDLLRAGNFCEALRCELLEIMKAFKRCEFLEQSDALLRNELIEPQDVLQWRLIDLAKEAPPDSRYYIKGILDLLCYCRDATIPGCPTPHLITPEEYSSLCESLGLIDEE